MTTGTRRGVAIIGVSVRVPKASSWDELATVFERGVDTVGPLPELRFAADGVDLGALRAQDRRAAFVGSFLDDVETFDAAHFDVSPLEARRMDPQQRLALEESWRALEDAGFDPRSLKGSRTGVFVGSSNRDYALSMAHDASKADVFKVMGSALGMTSNRVSHFFDLRGPSFTIDTACSSSLVALHQAVGSLERGEVELALVGGVNLVTSPHLSLAFSRARMLADDGRCKAFSTDADGYGRGEAVVFLVLMRGDDAERQQRRVYGELLGSAVNQDGRTEVITAPNVEAQVAVMHEALAKAGVDAGALSYVEAHGTGTPVGDRVEYEALLRVLRSAPRAAPCVVGTAKSYLGHAEPASGLVGVVKTLQAMHLERHAPHRHFTQLASGLTADANVLALPLTSTPWKRGTAPRIAGVSSFGFGGTNAHVVLREPARPHGGPAKNLTRFQGKPYWKKAEAVAPRTRAPEKRHTLEGVRAQLLAQVAQVLAADVKQLDSARAIVDLGVDSLELFTLLQRVEAQYQVHLSLDAVLAPGTTLDDVARLVIEGAGSAPPPPPRPSVGGALSAFAPRPPTPGAPTPADRAAVSAYTERTPGSKAQAEKFRDVLADNRNVAGFRANTKGLTYPLVADRAKGARLWDVDGNELVDLSMGFGVHLFGHAPDFLVTAAHEALSRGAPLGPQSPLAGEVATLLHELTGLERFAFTNSGTEAVMLACRLARAATRRERVVIFEGAYHGTFDGLLGRTDDPAEPARPLTPGTTGASVADLVVLPWDEPQSLAWLEEHAGSVAAILVEPVQSRRPSVQPRAFLHALRKVATSSGAALVFDEVITGFRCHVGGAQALFDVKADVAVYGKVLGGGFPIGAVGGSARFLDKVDGGTWRFDDDSAPSTDLAFFAGTFCKHPVAMATARATLKRLARDGGALLSLLTETTQRFCARLNAAFQQEQLQLEAVSFSSLFRLKSVRGLDHFFAHLNANGVYAWEGRTLFLSEAHGPEELARIEQAILAAARLTLRDDARHPVSPAQRRFLELPPTSLAGHVGFAISLSSTGGEGRGEEANRFREALTRVLTRHEIFRARFLDGTVSFDSSPRWTFERTTGDVAARLHALAHTPLPPGQVVSPPLTALAKFEWIDVGPTEAVFAGVFHGALLDAASLGVLLDSLARELRGEHPTTSPAQYRDYLAFAHARADDAPYWRTLFPTGLPPALFRLPADSRAQRLKRTWTEAQQRRMHELARRHRVTPFTFLFSLFSQALASTAAHDFAVAVPLADRRFPRGLEVVGNLTQVLAVPQARTLDVQARLAANAALLPRCYDHPGVSVGELRALVGGPEVQALFNLEPLLPLPRLGEATLTELDFPRPEARFPLAVHVLEGADYLRFDFDFLPGAVKASEVEALALRLEQLFEALT